MTKERPYLGQKNDNFIAPEFIENMEKRRSLILSNPEKFQKMPVRMKKILKYRYAIEQENEKYMSMRKIARKMKLSYNRVYQVHKEALGILEKDWN